jgi:hypothetical protein
VVDQDQPLWLFDLQGAQRENTAVFAPMPMAKVATTSAARPGLARARRSA